MILTNGIKASKASLSLNFVSNQDRRFIEVMSGSPAFDVTYGFGISTASSIVVCTALGGMTDIKVTGTMRYRAPTSSGSEYLGVFARMKSFGEVGQQDYIFARQHQGNARITQVIGGVFSNITSTAFALPGDVNVTITLTCIGNAVTASFSAAGLSTVNLAGITTILDGGFQGFRTLSQVGYCSSISVEEQ